MTRRTTHFLTLTSVTIGGLAIAVPASAQDVRRGPNNTLEVHFSGPCTVYYDRYGNRTYDTQPCNRYDRDRADTAVRNYLRGYGTPATDRVMATTIGAMAKSRGSGSIVADGERSTCETAAS